VPVGIPPAKSVHKEERFSINRKVAAAIRPISAYIGNQGSARVSCERNLFWQRSNCSLGGSGYVVYGVLVAEHFVVDIGDAQKTFCNFDEEHLQSFDGNPQ
jgi:hypothetical protein